MSTPATGDGTGSARAINNAGRIVGSATVAAVIMGIGTFNGAASGFRLTPIPEPASVAGLAVLSLAVAVSPRRRCGPRTTFGQNRRRGRPVVLDGSLTTEYDCLRRDGRRRNEPNRTHSKPAENRVWRSKTRESGK